MYRFSNSAACIVPTTPQEFAVFLRNEVAKWGKILKQAGVTLD